MRSFPVTRILQLLGVAAVAAVGLFVSSGSASAGWDETIGPPLSETSPIGGAIDLVNCDDGAIAKWQKSRLTFRIIDSADAGRTVVAAVRAGVLEWGRVGGPYALSEVTSGAADITLTLNRTLRTPLLLGTADVVCRSSRVGISHATIALAVSGLQAPGLQNLAAHETGHALGLGHANRTGDLMDPTYQKYLDGALLICPSNLDVKGLTSYSDPTRLLPVLWLTLPLC